MLIPRRDNDFNSFATHLIGVVKANPAAYGLTQEQADKVDLKIVDFVAKLAALVSAKDLAKSATAEKNVSRQDAEKNLREIIQIIYNFPDITEGLLETAGLFVHDTTPSPINVADPVGLKVESDENGDNSLNWSAGDNKPGTMYVIEIKRDPAVKFSFVDVVTKTKYIHKNQPAGVRTSYRIKAKRGDQVSSPSQVVIIYG